jgi:Fur family peroxide stress response transcriptional regulator
LAIAEAVLNSSDHPTVQQIHERVQQHFPSMTLATVYSTLGVLSKSGLIQELPFAKQSRYESNVSPHVNLVCVGCGSIADADDSSDIILRLRDEVSSETSFQVMWQRVDFHGWCRACSPDRE